MGKIDRLVKKVLELEEGDGVTYYYDREEVDMDEDPSAIITRCTLEIDVSPIQEAKDLVARIDKGNDDCWYSSDEMYRMPFIEDPTVLEYMIREISKHSYHPEAWE